MGIQNHPITLTRQLTFFKDTIMQQLVVLDKNKNPLMPCHLARARELLKKGRASVFMYFPFMIIIHDRDGGDTPTETIQVIKHCFFNSIHKLDGYTYMKGETALLPTPTGGGIRA